MDHIISRKPDGLPDIDKLSKDRKDWLGVFGNTWGTRHYGEHMNPDDKAAVMAALNPWLGRQ